MFWLFPPTGSYQLSLESPRFPLIKLYLPTHKICWCTPDYVTCCAVQTQSFKMPGNDFSFLISVDEIAFCDYVALMFHKWQSTGHYEGEGGGDFE